MSTIVFLILISAVKCESECPENICLKSCENGFLEDSNNCPICRCAICPKFVCNLQCKYGYKKSKIGCNLCDCSLYIKCKAPYCENDCPNGFLKDRRGCKTCECATGSEWDKCSGMSCPAWTECKEIATGCENALEGNDCKPKNTITCLKVCLQMKCKACKSGYLVGTDGCRTCKCIDPCEGVTCPLDQKCAEDQNEYGYTCSPKICKCPPPQPPTSVSALATRDICNGCNDNCNLFGCAENEKCCADWYGCMSCTGCRY